MEVEDGSVLDSDNAETIEKGSVQWNVYVAYLREGFGICFGVGFLISIFSSYSLISVFYGWWLAKWNDDEGHRHRLVSNCTTSNNKNYNMIRSMNETQWNEHRNFRFYYFCGWFECIEFLCFY